MSKRFRLYRQFLKLYPKPYRQKYGDQMVLTLGDMLDSASSRSQKTAIWLRTAFDLPLSILYQQITYVGDTMAHDMPPYIKRSSLIGALLVAPFFVFVIANALSGQRLSAATYWGPWFFFIWLIVLPTIAVVINGWAYIRWLRQRTAVTKKSQLHTIKELRQSWPLVTILVIGFGIVALVFGHDSVRCIGGNPFQEIANWHSTWRCIQTS